MITPHTSYTHATSSTCSSHSFPLIGVNLRFSIHFHSTISKSLLPPCFALLIPTNWMAVCFWWLFRNFPLYTLPTLIIFTHNLTFCCCCSLLATAASVVVAQLWKASMHLMLMDFNFLFHNWTFLCTIKIVII